MNPSLAGQLADFELPQILMVLEASRVTGGLTVTSAGSHGSIFFADGQILDATAETASGELAVFDILSWYEGEFLFTRGGEAPERTIDRSSQGLCLEAMRLIDESHNEALAFTPTPNTEAQGLDRDERRVLKALGEAGTVGAVAKVAGESAVTVYYRLEELERRGLVVRGDALTMRAELSNAAPRRVRVLVVDDSVLMQKVLKRTYESADDIEVVGMASNGQEALEMLPRLKPDVVSLDLYMPVMDGVTTLKHIMLSQPTPTVVVTSANADSLETTFESILRFGAIDFITKPSQSRGSIADQNDNIVDRIRKAARVDLRGLRLFQPPPRPREKRHARRGEARGAIVACGGTGGCLSYMQLLTSLPVDLPFAVIGLLSFPEDFLRGFVTYLNKCASFDVELAHDGAELSSGVCYLAPASHTPRIENGSSAPYLRLEESSEGSSYALFTDAVQAFRHQSVGLVLSGEGNDAFAGLAAVRAAGGITLAQLPASCVDPEQSQQATEQGLVDRVVVLPHISNDLSQLIMSRLRRSVSGRPWSTAESEATWPGQTA
jgi:two-component system chemotaxis response regulator CheB